MLPNLMLPDQESFPTSDDAGTLQRELFLTNSKIMQLINQQQEFEENEQRGMQVSAAHQANLRIENSLRSMMFIQVSIIVAIAFVQYLVFRAFANQLKKM